MKRLTARFAIAILLISALIPIFTACGHEHSYVDDNGLRYTSNGDGTCYVSGIGVCTDADIVIPTVSPNGEVVTGIGDEAFYDCSSLTSVVIGDSVTSIGEEAFSDCTSLTSVIIPDSVTSIGEEAFSDCTSLTSVIIPDSVTSIDYEAFSNCSSLTSVVIPGSVTCIVGWAFEYCTSLTSVVIPDSVTRMGYAAFLGCSSLTSIEVDVNNAAFKSIDGNLYTKDGKNLLQYAIGKSNTSFVIPDSVTSIGEYAFSACTSLTSIEIPDSVTSIGSYAFVNCTSLTNLEVSEGNVNYESIDGNLYTKGGKTLVQYATGKRDTSFEVPYSVTSIGDYAFYNCDSLTSIVIGDNVESIGNRAFEYCDSLTNIEVSEGSVSYESIDGNLYTKGGKTLVQYAIGKCDTSFEVPDGVENIGHGAFGGCSSLTSVVIPDSVTSIDEQAFYDCSSLSDVYYTGSEADWVKITIGSNNDYLKNATIHYNYVPQ